MAKHLVMVLGSLLASKVVPERDKDNWVESTLTTVTLREDG